MARRIVVSRMIEIEPPIIGRKTPDGTTIGGDYQQDQGLLENQSLSQEKSPKVLAAAVKRESESFIHTSVYALTLLLQDLPTSGRPDHSDTWSSFGTFYPYLEQSGERSDERRARPRRC